MHYLRVYNKRLELKKKSQLKLAQLEQYRNYVLYYEDVARIEAEIRSESCRKFEITLDKVFDMPFLKKVYRSITMNTQGTYLHILQGIFDQEIDIIKKPKSEPSDVIDHVKYAAIMCGYVRNLELMGFDTLRHLIKEIYSKK